MFVGVGAVAVVLIGGTIIAQRVNSDTVTQDVPSPVVQESDAAVPSAPVVPDVQADPAPAEPIPEVVAPVGSVKEFSVTSDHFSFDLKEIRVKQGDTVKITFHNSGGFHDWVIDEFNARTKQLKAGESETVQFVVDKTGTYEYYCSVGSHRAMGMKGNLIVE